jgi:hypothetical protein
MRMATIFRSCGLRFMIYSNDHPPPHVHVVGPGREARVQLGDFGMPPSVMTNDGLSRRELAFALIEIDTQQARLLQRWREIHGDV